MPASILPLFVSLSEIVIWSYVPKKWSAAVGVDTALFAFVGPEGAMITAFFATLPFVVPQQTTPVPDVSRELAKKVSQLDLSFDSKYCHVECTPDRELDARHLAADADASLDQMAQALVPLDAHVLDHIGCTILQYGTPQPGLADDGQSNTDSDYSRRIFNISVLARSSISPTSRTLVGESKNEDYAYKHSANELSAILLERVTRDNGEGWYFHQAPDWFVQGIAGYFGLIHSTAHSRDITLPKYISLMHSRPKEVSFENGLHVGNSYVGGLVLVMFLYDVYGTDRVNALLVSPKATFDEAFSDIFGDLGSVQSKYDGWIAAKPLLPPAAAH